ncbi:DUF7210 family protein [Metapseudomonas resinovorans]|uniref:DUF7210 family protein n=1 Tax=Metapseudomonas resinovorans TaxID=53412 RepID=UPI00040BEBBD|nr:hypothetical protein [Pseudomonas resinovorans]
MARTENAADPKQPATVEVTLDKPHTHKGQLKPAGTKIEVTEARKAWLEQQGVISGKVQEEQNNG